MCVINICLIRPHDGPNRPTFHESLPLLSSCLEKYFLSFGGRSASQAVAPSPTLKYCSTTMESKGILGWEILIDKHQYWWVEFLPPLFCSELCAVQKTATWVNLILVLKLLKDGQLRNLKSHTTRGSDAVALASGEARLPKYKHISHDQLKFTLHTNDKWQSATDAWNTSLHCIFVPILKHICSNSKMYLSKLHNVFVQI